MTAPAPGQQTASVIRDADVLVSQSSAALAPTAALAAEQFQGQAHRHRPAPPGSSPGAAPATPATGGIEGPVQPVADVAARLEAAGRAGGPQAAGGTAVAAQAVEISEAATVFAALADPARLRILAVLADSQRCVCDIQSAAPMATNLLSYHLRTLREAGLIVGTRRGRFVDYRLTDGAAARVCGALATAGFLAEVEALEGCAAECAVPAR